MKRCDRTTCFGNQKYECTILTEQLDPCPFYKTCKEFVDGIVKYGGVKPEEEPHEVAKG